MQNVTISPVKRAREAFRIQTAATVRNTILKTLQVHGAPLGLRVLQEIARDEQAPKAVRADCAYKLLTLAGFVAPKAEAAAPGEKMLGEMSQDELRRIVDECENELAARAKPVSLPTSAGLEVEALDIFD
jgi:hypothetical protein